jgi:hypothetical protein
MNQSYLKIKKQGFKLFIPSPEGQRTLLINYSSEEVGQSSYKYNKQILKIQSSIITCQLS